MCGPGSALETKGRLLKVFFHWEVYQLIGNGASSEQWCSGESLAKGLGSSPKTSLWLSLSICLHQYISSHQVPT